MLIIVCTVGQVVTGRKLGYYLVLILNIQILVHCAFLHELYGFELLQPCIFVYLIWVLGSDQNIKRYRDINLEFNNDSNNISIEKIMHSPLNIIKLFVVLNSKFAFPFNFWTPLHQTMNKLSICTAMHLTLVEKNY